MSDFFGLKERAELGRCSCGASQFASKHSDYEGCRHCRNSGFGKPMSIEEIEAMRPEWNRKAAEYTESVRIQMEPIIKKLVAENKRQKLETPEQTDNRRGYCHWWRGKNLEERKLG